MSVQKAVNPQSNQSWLRFLPEILRNRLNDRHDLQLSIGNTGWLLFERMLRIVLGLSIGAWVARYLGPVQFGQLAYVLSILAFFQVIADLHADGFIVRDITQSRGKPSELLGTAFWLRMFLGVFGWLAASTLMLVSHPEDPQLARLTVIVGAFLPFRACDTIDLWFQSQSQSRRTVLAKVTGSLLSNGVRVALLLGQAPLAAFAATITLEGVATAVSLAFAYRRFPTGTSWKATLNQAQALLILCWPFIASAFLTTVFMRVDQIMLKEIMGERELGIFAAALPISQALVVVPTIMVVSLGPLVARKFSQSEAAYEATMCSVFRLFAALSFSGAALLALASPWIIELMYGSQYQAASAVLAVHVFANVFIFQGLAQDLWVVNRTVRSVTLISTFLGAVTGIACNAFLIRRFGLLGAVFSYILAQAVSNTVIPLIMRADLRCLYKRAFLGFATDRKGPRPDAFA